MNCPGCDALVETQTLEGNYGKPIVLDLCYPCGAMWFDGFENLQLTPSSILDLFKLIHEKRTGQGSSSPQSPRCPHCRARLIHTNDRQRTTTFFYDRCPKDHGRFITFFQFLREKNFVRSLSPKEIAELKQKVKMLHCSNCGAGVNLEKESACSYCQSPISMLDPRQMEKTVHDLQRAEERRTNPARYHSAALDQLQIDKLAGSRNSSHDGILSHDPFIIGGLVDLVWGGVAVVASTFSDS